MFRTMLLVATATAAFGATSGDAANLLYTGAWQQFTAGPAGLYTLAVAGASGGGFSSHGVNGGRGAYIVADVPLAVGQRLDVAVGGVGRPGTDDWRTFKGGGGGGGGTFVLDAAGRSIVVAGGGGGAGYQNTFDSFTRGFRSGRDAVVGTSGTSGGGNPFRGGGAGGTNGSGGQGAHLGGAGGGGVFSAGGEGATYSGHQAAEGGKTGSGDFAGGRPLHFYFGTSVPGGRQGYDIGGAGGFGGGGGGGGIYDLHGAGGGGGGGYSGGGGGGIDGPGGAGGGGGSFVAAAGVLRGTGLNAVAADGTAAIALQRVFATGAVLTPSLDFGTVRAGSAAVYRDITVANTSRQEFFEGRPYETTDYLVATIDAAPTGLTGYIPISPLFFSGQQAGGFAVLSTARPGVVSGNIDVNFTSLDAFGGTNHAVKGGTIAVTGLITDVARAGFSAGGIALEPYDNGRVFRIDLGDVIAGRSIATKLSVSNLIGASSYAESLLGSFDKPEDYEGFDFSDFVQNFDVAGGATAVLGTLRFTAPKWARGGYTADTTGYTSSHFTGLNDTSRSYARFSFTANVIAGAAVPEPATWGLMIAGFGMIGAAMRRRAALVA